MSESPVTAIKTRIYEAIDELEPRLVDLSMRIHRHPETKFEEHNASEWLAHAAKEAGFAVEMGIGELETAFRATYRGSEKEPVIAFLAEYDALLTFQNINALREHVVDDAWIHGIITDGGDAPNIVPDYAASLFYVRALDDDTCDDLLEKVRKCARAAALATGAEVKMDMQGAYRSLRTNMPLAEAFKENLEALGWTFEEVDPTAHIGSTDMGDVSHITNTIHPYLSIGPEELVGHSTEFAEAAASERGHRAMIDAVKVLAATAADVLLRPALLESVKAYAD